MDDILCIYAENDKWDHTKFLQDLCKSKVYVAPLKLEDGAGNTFLETRFNIEDTSIRYLLKNDNEKEIKIWRYKHVYSHGDYIQKRSIITACLRKIQKQSSDDTAMIKSATHKLNEFTQLKYPRTTLKGICTFLAATSGNGAWITVRNLIQ